MKRKDKRFAPVCFTFCHAAYNIRNDTFYVRTNINSPVGSQVYCGVYPNMKRAAYTAKWINRILVMIDNAKSLS